MEEEKGRGRPEEEGVTAARLMDGSVFVKAENRNLASDKHNILLLIFPAWLPRNPNLPSDSSVWKLLSLVGSIKTREFPFAQHVSTVWTMSKVSKKKMFQMSEEG